MSKPDDPTKDNEYNEKYKITLKFINAILNNIGKEPIDDLVKFVDIDRLELMKDVNKTTLDNMKYEIFSYFDIRKCRYNTPSKNVVLNCLQGMLHDFGYILNKSIPNADHLLQIRAPLKDYKIIYSVKKM